MTLQRSTRYMVLPSNNIPQSRRKDPPYLTVGGGASRMLRGLMLRRRAVLGSPKCEKYVGRRGSAPDPGGGAYSTPPNPLAGGEGALLPPSPRTPLTILSLCLSCVHVMYTRVWKCTVIFPWMLNMGPHSCIWGGGLQLSSAGTDIPYTHITYLFC